MAFLARQHGEEVLEQRRVGDKTAVAMRDDVAPIRFARRGARRDDDPEVARPRVGSDVDAVAVIHPRRRTARAGAT